MMAMHNFGLRPTEGFSGIGTLARFRNHPKNGGIACVPME